MTIGLVVVARNADNYSEVIAARLNVDVQIWNYKGNAKLVMCERVFVNHSEAAALREELIRQFEVIGAVVEEVVYSESNGKNPDDFETVYEMADRLALQLAEMRRRGQYNWPSQHKSESRLAFN